MVEKQGRLGMRALLILNMTKHGQVSKLPTRGVFLVVVAFVCLFVAFQCLFVCLLHDLFLARLAARI